MAHFFLKRAQNETNDSTSLLFCCAFLEKAQKSSLKWKKINFMAHFFLKRAQNETNDSTSLLFCCAFLEKAQKSSLKWKKINFMAGSLDTKLALLLIEEGAAIRLSKDGTDYIFQRNPGLDYFNYRKWRKTEAYGISSEKRNKIYCVQGAADIKLFTRETFTEFVGELPVLSVQQPLGCDYTAKQVRLIKKDIDRLIGCLRQFC